MLTNLSQTILKDLNPRLRDIIERRFGLKNSKREPLEAIGKDYQITRERVRQLEANAISQIEKNLTSDIFDFFKLSENHLKLFKGIRKEDQFLSELIYLLDEKTSQLNFNILNFLLSFDKNLKLIPQNKSHFSFWTNDVNYSEQVLKFINGFYKYLQILFFHNVHRLLKILYKLFLILSVQFPFLALIVMPFHKLVLLRDTFHFQKNFLLNDSVLKD